MNFAQSSWNIGQNTIRKQYNVPKIEIEFYKNFDEDTNTYNARINVYKYFARPQPYLLLELNMDFLNCKIDADMAKVEQFEQIAYRNLQEAHQFLVKIKT